MKSLIVVPARYGSTRFPGKPLALIGGVPMVVLSARVAARVAEGRNDIDIVVATDDHRIETVCREHDIPVVLTDPELPSGSDRVLAAVKILAGDHEILVNLQGDAPLTPPAYIEAVLNRLLTDPVADIATPVVQLPWAALDRLRENKRVTPFSGTTAIVDAHGHARWFSKNIIPAIRKEDTRRGRDALSPVRQHVGLYAYRRAALVQYAALDLSHYEEIEGLEQLRALEAGMVIACVSVDATKTSQSGIDTREDMRRVEAELAALSIAGN